MYHLFCFVKMSFACENENYPLTQSYKDFSPIFPTRGFPIWGFNFGSMIYLSDFPHREYDLAHRLQIPICSTPLLKVGPFLYWLELHIDQKSAICLVFHQLQFLNPCFTDMCADSVLTAAAGC